MNNEIKQGWQCPKCDRILSPYTEYCKFCIHSGNPTISFDYEDELESKIVGMTD